MRLKYAGNPSIYMRSGRRFHFLRPKPSEITIEDIAWGLARTARYYGQTHGEPYSVAQHAILASCHCAPGHEWASLNHDNAEAYAGDVQRFLKALLPDYVHIQNRVIEPAVMRAFKVPYPFAPEVHQIDHILAATEMRDLQRRTDWKDGPYKPLDIRIKPWPWRKAYHEFLKRFRELSP